MKTNMIVPVLVLLLAGCASSSEKDGAAPDWIDGSSERYPQSAYLVGIGSADDLATARDRARSDLAKIFQVSVNEVSRDEQQFSQTGSAGEYSANAQRNITLRTQQVLEGVTVPESWRDSQGGRYHALAVLNRSQAAARLRSDIGGLDAASETLMNRARVANDAFTRAQLALEVVETQRQRASLQAMLRAVDPTGRGIPPLWPLAQLEADLRTALSRITLRATGEPRWQQMLAGQLSDSGFTVSDSGEYEVNLAVEPNVMQRDGWQWVRGVAVLTVRGTGGRSLGQQRWEFKESATDRATAMLRFEEAVAAKLGSEGRDAILKTVRD